MKTKMEKLSMSAVMMATVFVVTRFIQIPIPLGYFNVGNCVILLFCLTVDNHYGVAASGLGSALADLVSYPVYTLPTLAIKGFMAWVFIKDIRTHYKRKNAYVMAAAVATLIPLIGYTIAGGLIYGNILSGLVQFPGLAVEYAANLAIFAVMHKSILKLAVIRS